MKIRIWTCPNCGDLMEYRGTSYEEAMDMIGVDEHRRAGMEKGVDETYERMFIEIRTSGRDCYGCRDDIKSP